MFVVVLQELNFVCSLNGMGIAIFILIGCYVNELHASILYTSLCGESSEMLEIRSSRMQWAKFFLLSSASSSISVLIVMYGLSCLLLFYKKYIVYYILVSSLVSVTSPSLIALQLLVTEIANVLPKVVSCFTITTL